MDAAGIYLLSHWKTFTQISATVYMKAFSGHDSVLHPALMGHELVDEVHDSSPKVWTFLRHTLCGGV